MKLLSAFSTPISVQHTPPGVHVMAHNRDSDQVINIPISSTIFYNTAKAQAHYFVLDSYIQLTVNHNGEGKSPPPGSTWSGPWIGMCMPTGTFDISIRTNSETELPKYYPTTCYIRVATSKSPARMISCSPCNAHAWRGSSGLAQSRGRWNVTTHHQVDAGKGAKRQSSVTWQYIKNPEPDYCMRARLKPLPELVFGYNTRSRDLPSLEVELTVHWSSKHRTRKSRKLVLSLRPPERDLIELVHRASIVVSPGRLPSRSSVADSHNFDRVTTKTLAAAEGPICFKPVAMTLGDDEVWKADTQADTARSDTAVLIQRSAEGRLRPPAKGRFAGLLRRVFGRRP